MVTMLPRPRPASAPTFTWQFAETFWPAIPQPAPCQLDADAARLLRYALTFAVEQALTQRRTAGVPLPTCSVQQVRQRRFDPQGVLWERHEELQGLLIREAQLLFRLVVCPLGKDALGRDRAQEWAALLAQQVARVGCLYQALEQRMGRQVAFSDLALALEACARD